MHAPDAAPSVRSETRVEWGILCYSERLGCLRFDEMADEYEARVLQQSRAVSEYAASYLPNILATRTIPTTPTEAPRDGE